MDKISYAKNQCKGFAYSEPLHSFNKIYPFTTENISGYIDLFDLEDKSLLTVGSSSDQIINAVKNGCKDITILDICPYTEEYYYLKTSAIEVLDYEDFFRFLCYRGFYGLLDNPFALSSKSFEKIKETLKEKSEKSYNFWTTMYEEYKGKRIRQRIFSLDENNFFAVVQSNPYLHNEYSYLETRKKLKEITPTFIEGDIRKTELTKSYDNIWLSNLPAYLYLPEIKKLFEKLEPHVKDKILFSYLYGITEHTTYERSWDDIYNIKRIKKEISDELIFHSFLGIRGIEGHIYDQKDGVLIYQKKK